jgi:hypothetical protein
VKVFATVVLDAGRKKGALRSCRKMATITYRHQPGIQATRGRVPLGGTSHLYRVTKLLWPEAVEDAIKAFLIPVSLHVCSGHSQLGDIRLDIDENVHPHVLCDASRLPFADKCFRTVLCDPPYNGRYWWNHAVLSELARVGRTRIIFQHWFVPADSLGRYKKSHEFHLVNLFAWQPRTYFDRGQFVSIFDAR